MRQKDTLPKKYLLAMCFVSSTDPQTIPEWFPRILPVTKDVYKPNRIVAANISYTIGQMHPCLQAAGRKATLHLFYEDCQE